MNDFKLKLVLSVLGGIVFSFLFIVLAFSVPLNREYTYTPTKPTGKLEKISHAFQER